MDIRGIITITDNTIFIAKKHKSLKRASAQGVVLARHLKSLTFLNRKFSVFLPSAFRQYKKQLEKIDGFCEFYFITKSKSQWRQCHQNYFVSQIILNVRCQPLDFTVTSIYYIFVKKPASCLMAQKAQTVLKSQLT
jgi:hypothetical protein